MSSRSAPATGTARGLPVRSSSRVPGAEVDSVGTRTVNHDVLELLNLLGRPALEHVKIALREVSHRRSVLRREDVNVDVIGFSAKGRLRRLILRGGEDGGHTDQDGEASEHGAPSGSWLPSG
jgi:hypothetical protein